MSVGDAEKVIFPPNTQINDWIIQGHIGHGGYGEIYEVIQPPSDVRCAMKTEFRNARKHGINEEITFLSFLQGSPYFPCFIESGETADIFYFVMELLGPTVSALRRTLPDQRYTRLTSTVIAKEMLQCLEELHRRGFVHRDLKPGNFLFRTDQKHLICLIDFGLSRRFIDPQTGEPLPPREKPGFVGTCSFASVNAQDGLDLGRRDDIISWLYTIIEITERGLPWPGSKNRDATYQMKKNAKASELCRSLPPQFIEIYEATMELGFADPVDYERYYRLLDAAIDDEGRSNAPFDWERLDPTVVPLAQYLPKRNIVISEELSPEENVPHEVPCPASGVSENASRAHSTAPGDDVKTDAHNIGDVQGAAEPVRKGKRDWKKKKKPKPEEDDEPICQGCFVA
jgi:serine/threonine protein kinase